MGCTAVVADDIKINGEFKNIDGKGFPVGWIQNKGGKWAEPFGTVNVVKITESDGDVDNAVQIVSAGKRTEVYTSTQHAAKAGEKIEIEVKAKGTGKVSFGVYVYGEKSWLLNQVEERELTADFQEFKATLTIKDGAKEQAVNVRFFIGATPGADVTIKEIDAEKKN
jgi:hypothetical protein